MNGMNFTEARGDNSAPRKRRTIRVQHVASPARKPLVIKPCSNTKINAAFAALGGVNVPTERRASKSRGLMLAETEDSLREREIVEGNDPLARKSFDERVATAAYEIDDEEEDANSVKARLDRRGLAVCLLSAGNVTPEIVMEAAKVAVNEPEVLVSLYRAGMRVEGVEKHKVAARMKIFELLQRIVSAMLEIHTPEQISQLLDDQVDVEDGKDYRDLEVLMTQKTLLARLASWARNEMRNNGYGHYTAARILRALGYNNVYASYLG